jgi:hypothetical protein
MNAVKEEMQKLVTATTKREYAATNDKYIYAKDLLEGYLPDDVVRIVTDRIVECFEDMLEE